MGKHGSYHSIKLKTFSFKKCHICYYTFSKHKFDICKANPHISTQSGVLTHRLHFIKSVRLIALFSSSNGQCQGKYGSYHSIKLKTFSFKKCLFATIQKINLCKDHPHISTQSGVLTHRLHFIKSVHLIALFSSSNGQCQGKYGSYHSIKLKTFSFKKCHICYYTFSKHKFDICKANPHISTQSGVLTHRLHLQYL